MRIQPCHKTPDKTFLKQNDGKERGLRCIMGAQPCQIVPDKTFLKLRMTGRKEV